jgi:tetratricopeptide (TPR) repeat protein
MRIAQGLLAAGLGEPAREQAREATRLAPKDPAAFKTLAEVLSHDLLGRLHRKGFDPEGAAAAYQKAIDLDPDDPELSAGLAYLFEVNAEGERYAADARLDDAIRLYQKMSDEDLARLNITSNLPMALAKAGRYAELEQWTRGPRDADTFLALRLTAVAAQRGSAEAVAEANRATRDEAVRTAALLAAGYELMGKRRYADAAALFRAGSRGRDDAAAILAQADFIGKVTPYDPAAASDDPTTPYRRLIAMMFTGKLTLDELRPLLAARLQQADIGADDASFQAMASSIRQMLRKAHLPPETALDLLISRSDFRVDGDPKIGCRVTTTLSAAGAPESIFVTRENGKWVLVETGFFPQAPAAGLGAEAAAALERGEVAAAGVWFEWARELVASAPTDSIYALPFQIFYRGAETADPERLKLAAAALSVPSDREAGDRVLDLLRDSPPRALTPPEEQALTQIRASAFASAGKPDSALAAVHRLQRVHPNSRYLYAEELQAYAKLKSLAGAREASEARLARLPGDPDAVRQLMEIAAYTSDWASVRAYGRKLDALHKLTPGDLNNWAWYDLMAGAVTDTTLDRINRAILDSQENRFSFLHTQASIYAELNRPAEARDILYQAMDLQGLDDPDESSWYVLGRIAEQYDLPDAARDAYKRITPSLEEYGWTSSVYTVAQRRLGGLARRGR